MTKTEALALADKLWEMACAPPGAQRVDEIERIVFALGTRAPLGYTREKLREARAALLIWNAPRKWKQWGEERAKSLTLNAVGKLQMAIRSDWPEDPTGERVSMQ